MHRALAGLIGFLIVGCGGGPTHTQSETSSAVGETSSSASEKNGGASSMPSPSSEATNLLDSTPNNATSKNATATTSSSASTSSPSTRRTPPPHEKWMDTMMSLSGVEPPNQAKMLEDEPVALNLRSVEILIAQRYKPEKPISLTIRAYVTENGTVGRVQLLHNSQPDMVPSYFLPPLRELRFQPAKENGKPISTWTTLTLNIQPI